MQHLEISELHFTTHYALLPSSIVDRHHHRHHRITRRLAYMWPWTRALNKKPMRKATSHHTALTTTIRTFFTQLPYTISTVSRATGNRAISAHGVLDLRLAIGSITSPTHVRSRCTSHIIHHICTYSKRGERFVRGRRARRISEDHDHEGRLVYYCTVRPRSSKASAARTTRIPKDPRIDIST